MLPYRLYLVQLLLLEADAIETATGVENIRQARKMKARKRFQSWRYFLLDCSVTKVNGLKL
jgi:hypothetical protein